MQAILFNNKQYNKQNSGKWLSSHVYRPIKPPHVTKNYIRYRLQKPNGEHYRTIPLTKTIKAITMRPKRKYGRKHVGGDLYSLITQSPRLVNNLIGVFHALTSLGILGGVGYAVHKKVSGRK